MTRNVVRIAAVALAAAGLSASAVETGQPAPAFEAKDTKGATHSLASLKGKYIVLEWINPGCPFVRRHYDSKNMQNLQKQWTDKGVVWLTVSSAGVGKPGYFDAEGGNKLIADKGLACTALLLDADGKVGKAFGAKTTPHLFVIDPDGKLIYQGAVDDKPTTDAADNATAKNFVSAALEEAMAGKPVTTGATRAYGCGVKFAE